MASKLCTSSLFTKNYSSKKSLGPWRLLVSSCKSSKTTLCIASSAPRAATDHVRSGLTTLVAPPTTIATTPAIKDNVDYIFVDPRKPDVIPSEVDMNYSLDELKEKTRRALVTASDPTAAMKLIDAIQRLGIGHCFEEEIKELLQNQTQGQPANDLYTVALRFRLQRENGIHTNPEIFENFMDESGKFKKSLSGDIDGLLSLYEASYMGANGESVLSQAMEFTNRHLKKPVSKLSPNYRKRILEALEIPRHMRMGRLEARSFMEEYGAEEDHNPVVLELAELEYKNVQSLLKREMVEVTRWWRGLDLVRKLGFVRDRHVESCLWVVGILPDPKYSEARIELAKSISILLVLDDIFDTYGSYDDLVLFTEAIKRWDLNETEQLPEYMKICYGALYNTIEETSYKVHTERGLSVGSYLRKTWIDLVEAYMVEVEWAKRKTTPKVEDYIKNGIVSSGTYMALVHAFFLISEGVSEENLSHLLDPYPKFFFVVGMVLRLWDDLGTTKEEKERGDVLSSIQLIMTEKQISCEDEGRKQILQLIRNSWKDLNAELVKPDLFLFPMIKAALNTSRASQVVYDHSEDSYLSSVENSVQFLFGQSCDY